MASSNSDTVYRVDNEKEYLDGPTANVLTFININKQLFKTELNVRTVTDQCLFRKIGRCTFFRVLVKINALFMA